MTISGIGLNTGATGFPTRPDNNQGAANSRLESPNGVNNTNQPQPNSAPNGGPETTSRDGSLVTTTNAASQSVPSQANRSNSLSSSRRNLADTEATANQFRLQRENSQGNPAVREFLSVANFEQRDNLSNTTGIDIFV